MMSANQPSPWLTRLMQIAHAAGARIMTIYNSGFEVAEKSDASPVTDADTAAEAIILDGLRTLDPGANIIAEEAVAGGAVPKVTGEFYLVDPLDGTREFISRNGEFTVNIALIEKGEPVAGVVHAPAMAMTWAGACGPEGESLATFSETDGPVMPIEIRKAPQEGLTVVASRRHGQGGELDSFLERFEVEQMVSRFGRTMEWDTAAGHAVLRAAGGRVEDAEGKPLTYGKPGFENPHFIGYADC
jgi:3'(2'), 5'-bisphosphate nucleotidase